MGSPARRRVGDTWSGPSPVGALEGVVGRRGYFRLGVGTSLRGRFKQEGPIRESRNPIGNLKGNVGISTRVVSSY